MPLYALKAGQKHYKRNRSGDAKHRLTLMKPGEIVELRDSQYKAFSDKFDYVGRTEGEEAVETAETDSEGPVTPVLVRREDGGYDLVNPDTEKVLNDNPLALGDVAEIIETYKATVSDETAEAIAQDTVASVEEMDTDDSEDDENSGDDEPDDEESEDGVDGEEDDTSKEDETP